MFGDCGKIRTAKKARHPQHDLRTARPAKPKYNLQGHQFDGVVYYNSIWLRLQFLKHKAVHGVVLTRPRLRALRHCAEVGAVNYNITIRRRVNARFQPVENCGVCRYFGCQYLQDGNV